MFGVSAAMVFAVIYNGWFWLGLRISGTKRLLELFASCARYGYQSPEVSAPVRTTATAALKPVEPGRFTGE
jgi:hypothetical protein